MCSRGCVQSIAKYPNPSQTFRLQVGLLLLLETLVDAGKFAGVCSGGVRRAGISLGCRVDAPDDLDCAPIGICTLSHVGPISSSRYWVGMTILPSPGVREKAGKRQHHHPALTVQPALVESGCRSDGRRPGEMGGCPVRDSATTRTSKVDGQGLGERTKKRPSWTRDALCW